MPREGGGRVQPGHDGGGEGGDQQRPPVGIGRRAENVQPIADGQILHVAEVGIEPRQRVVLGRAGWHAAFGQHTGRIGVRKDAAAQSCCPATVQAVGGGVFVDHPLQHGSLAVATGGA